MGMPIQDNKAMQPDISVKAIEHIHKLKETTSFFFILTVAVVVLTLVFHTFPNAKKYKATSEEIIEYEYKILNLNKTTEEQIKMRDARQEIYDKLIEKSAPKLAVIFPDNEDINNLTKFLEDFAMSYHSQSNPFELNNISFGASRRVTQGNYHVLPIITNIRASEANFYNFLNMIARSGSLDENDFFKGNPIRLMGIERINITVPTNVTDAENPEYNFNIQINAFFDSKKKL